MADFLREEHIERTLYDHFRNVLPEGTYIHKADTPWASKPDQWVEPRIGRINRNTGQRQRRGASSYPMTLEVRCIQVSACKGEALSLARFTDTVRTAVDASAKRAAIPILDDGGNRVGLIQFGEADTGRAHDQTVVVDGVSTPHASIATLSVVCQVATL